MEYALREDPRESLRWRRHTRGCPHYRERWFAESDVAAGEPMYQVFCGQNTPPTTIEEQEKCLASARKCWRLVEAERQSRGSVDIPLSRVSRAKRSANAPV